VSNPIPAENQNTGTTAWQVTTQAFNEIQCYAVGTSVDPGGSIAFCVSTQVAGTTYTITIYRLGYYQGTGGCLKATITGQVGVAQGYYDSGTQILNNCPTAIIDSTTHSIDAGWATSYTWSVPSNAVSGVYLVLVTDANGKQNCTSFIVRGNSTADYVVVRATTTDQAYNTWGGWSLYTNPTVGTKVSYNRPIYGSAGTGNLLGIDLPAIKWFESQGYNLGYLADIDVHATANILLTYKAVIMLGHDEYWTLERRNATEAARDAGISLAFLCGNGCFWQCRLEADSASNANRTLVCYKVQSKNSNLATDPKYGVDNTRISCNWRDPFLNKPESTMMGIMFSSLTTGGVRYGWTVDKNANSSFLTGTGLVNGTTYGTDIVGVEWDKQMSGSPNGLQIIGNSYQIDSFSSGDTSHTAYYFASSGAMVFAAGSMSWIWCLDTYRFGSSGTAIAGMQSLMANIMTALIKPIQKQGFSSFAVHR
jgi:hypothetical protein